MRVLLISHSAALYGAQRSLLDLARGLRGEGIEPIAAIPEEGPLGVALRSDGIETRILPCRNWVNSRGAFHWHRKFLLNRIWAARASKWVSGAGIDLVHTNSVVIPIGAMIARRLGLPHVWHVREGMPPRDDFFIWPFSKVTSFIQETTRFMIGISDHTCKGMESFCPKERIRRIYNGPISEEVASYPLPKRAPFRDRGLNLLCVGRSGPAKGHDVAVRALAQLRNQGREDTLTIAGDVPASFREELIKLSPNGIHFAGYVSETRPLYDSHDVFLMTSQKEAFGRVTVEAMARECIVVGTNSGGTPELIEDGQSGLLFEPGNVEQLVESIEKIRLDEGLAKELAEGGRRHAFREFTRERYARNVATLYREAIKA